MKKILFLLSLIVALVIFGFTKDAKNQTYKNNLHENTKADFTLKIDNEELKTFFEINFQNLFHEVNSINANFSKTDNIYYYSVQGKKNNRDVIENFIVEESDIKQETYSYLDISLLNNDIQTVYCRKANGVYPACPVTCQPQTGCLGAICGVFVNGVCNTN